MARVGSKTTGQREGGRDRDREMSRKKKREK
jgi:hypothetical protein